MVNNKQKLLNSVLSVSNNLKEMNPSLRYIVDINIIKHV
jgi:hypothetical protein